MIREEVDNVVLTDTVSPHVTSDHVSCSITSFQSLSTEDLHVPNYQETPTKSYDLDPMPTWLMKEHLPTIIPVLCRIVNDSLATGTFPSELRNFTHILKKPSIMSMDHQLF